LTGMRAVDRAPRRHEPSEMSGMGNGALAFGPKLPRLPSTLPEPTFRKWLLWLLDTQQMPAEKCEDRGIEVLVEGCPIKARSIDANPGKVVHFRGRARR
jgi:hypothetical protein